VSRDGSRLFVGYAAGVAALDPATGRVLDRIPVPAMTTLRQAG
jgi:hypothetical protein